MDRSRRPSAAHQLNQMNQTGSSSRNDISLMSGRINAPAQARLDMLPDPQQIHSLSNQLYHWYAERDGPWHPVVNNSYPMNRAAIHHPSFSSYRNNNASSECGTVPSVVPGSDSGYGTGPRPSVGTQSVYEGADQSFDTHSLIGHFKEVNIQGFGQITSPGEYRPEGDGWMQQVVHGSLGPGQNDDSIALICPICQKPAKTKSELTKHTHRHTKPHRCEVAGCKRRLEGFSTPNDLERHMRSVHSKPGVKYRCNQGQCSVKDKPWPRADNFRQHLKRVHKIETTLNDDLKLYIIRDSPSSDTLLAGMGCSDPLKMTGSQDSPNALTLSDGQDDSSGHVLTPSETQDDLGQAWSYPDESSILAALGVRDAAAASHLDAFLRDPALHAPAMTSNPHETPAAQPSANLKTTEASSGKAQQEETALLASPAGSHHRPGSSGNAPLHPSPPANPPIESRLTVPALLKIPLNLFQQLKTPGSNKHAPFSSSQDLGSPRLAGSETLMSVDNAVEDTPASPDEAVDSNSNISKNSETSPLASSRINTPADDNTAEGSPLQDEATNSDPQGTGNKKLEEAKLLLEALRQAGKLDELMQDCGYQKAGKAAKQDGKRRSPPTLASEERPTCVDCNKTFHRHSELRKHSKRHARPYACTHLKCSKRFGSKNDWKRHEISQHFRSEYWECKGYPGDTNDGRCTKTFHRRESFQHHLKSDHGVKDEDLINKICTDNRVGKNCESSFWCGYCVQTIEHKKKGLEAWTERFDHIDDHANARNGLPKMDISQWQHLAASRVTEGENAGMHGPSDEAHDWDVMFADSVNGKPQAQPSGSAKRKNDAVNREDERTKRRKSQESSRSLWTCCRCKARWDSQHVKTCLSDGCQHDQCSNCESQQHRSNEQPRHSRRTDDATWMWTCCRCGDYWGWATTKACMGPTCSHPCCDACAMELQEVEDED